MASKKTGSRVVKKTGPKTAKRGTVKKSARKTKSYNPQTGKHWPCNRCSAAPRHVGRKVPIRRNVGNSAA
jgi:hypothetical protein